MELELKLLSISPLYFVAICTIYVYVRIFPRQREYIYKRARTLLCKELAHTLVRAAGLKSVGQAGRLEIQVRVDVAVLGLNSAGWSGR